ncbi:protein ABIL1-like [Telopea speciosissima]|uniref:protein ABIL1-like n=1 Tax=Telopea speciosissima TaxID=54955 RepID=UPI001CC4A14A|nr:protein ABIL1-like [Telopea speciosissima]
MQQLQPKNPAMTFDEVSTERSMSFVKALQELKTLRPQLYSAAEYCEKSYLHSEQKQMVLDNLKDYAVRALVNAVDHLGTVAYKLNDIFEQQVSDVSTLDQKLSCLNQKILTCQIYTDKEGLKQQQLLTFIRRHHKHYILPKSINKKVQFSPQIQTDARQKHILGARPRINPSGTPASKTLSWHLASETDSTLNGTQNALMGIKDPKATGTTLGVFQLLDSDEAVSLKSSAPHLQTASGSPASSAVLQTFGVTRRDSLEVSKQLTAFRSFDNLGRRDIVRPPIRSKSMLSAFFTKHKSTKL